MHLLRGEQRESRSQIESHLVTKNTPCTGAGTITFVGTMIHYMPEQIEVLLHKDKGYRSKVYDLTGAFKSGFQQLLLRSLNRLNLHALREQLPVKIVRKTTV